MNEKFTCPECGYPITKKIYESRHKNSARCKSNQKNKIKI